jgi:hypothetical protein
MRIIVAKLYILLCKLSLEQTMEARVSCGSTISLTSALDGVGI